MDADRTSGPILLGNITESSEDGEKTGLQSHLWRTLPRHRDEDQVRLDVDRSFIYYPNSKTPSSGRAPCQIVTICKTSRKNSLKLEKKSSQISSPKSCADNHTSVISKATMTYVKSSSSSSNLPTAHNLLPVSHASESATSCSPPSRQRFHNSASYPISSTL